MREPEKQQPEQGRRSRADTDGGQQKKQKEKAAGTRASKRCSLALQGRTAFPGDGGSGEQQQKRYFPSGEAAPASSPASPGSRALPRGAKPRQPRPLLGSSKGSLSRGTSGSRPHRPVRSPEMAPQAAGSLSAQLQRSALAFAARVLATLPQMHLRAFACLSQGTHTTSSPPSLCTT